MESYTQKEPIRILNVVPNMRAAGIETFIMNVYRNIDRKKVQFDFLVHNEKKEFYDDEIEKLGGKIYRLSFKDDKNIIKYIKNLDNFFKEHKEYKIVHGHMQSMMPLYLYIAQKNKVPVRIAHSHNGNYEKTLKGFILHVFSRFSKKYSSHNISCSDLAGEYLFGKKSFTVVPNGINVKKFEFDENIRQAVRNELSLSNEYVIGHVGRFELQKNHRFLIEIFNEKLKENSNYVLLLIGEGKYEKEIKKIVKKLNIENKVKFLGVRKDMDRLYQAMDCFILPSLYEGLPVVGVEAQASGLKCLFSDTITKELKITSNAVFIPLQSKQKWLKEIDCNDKCKNRKSFAKIVAQNFEIKNISKKLERFYLINNDYKGEK